MGTKNAHFSTGQFVHVINVGDGVRIGQRSDQKKPNWYLIAVETHTVRRSLNTTDVNEAKRMALDFYQLYLRQGLRTAKDAYLATPSSTARIRSFKSVAETWLERETRGVAYKADVLRKFLLPFFDVERKVQDIRDVDQAMVQDYKHWRRTFWQQPAAKHRGCVRVSERQQQHYSAPSASTINRELPVLRQILRFAADRGLMEHKDLPKVEAERTKPARRPAFRDDHFREFLGVIDQRIANAETTEDRWRYELLRDWCVFARLTGVRLPHEADQLCWKHVDFYNQKVTIPEDTKTGSRTLPLNTQALELLQRRFTDRQQQLGSTENSLGQERVFVMPDGRSYTNLGKLFQHVDGACPYAQDGHHYTPYSLRHAFATQSVSQNVPLPVLSKAMGATTKMLEAHYVQVTADQLGRHLLDKIYY